MDINPGAGMNGIEATPGPPQNSGVPGDTDCRGHRHTLAGDRERILSQGLTHYLPKSFDRNEIVEIVASALVPKSPL